MIGGFLGKRGASRLLRAISRTVLVPAATGAIQTLPNFGLKAPVVHAKTGGNANLTIAGGAITAAAAIAVGVSQTITGTATGADGVVVPWTYICTGQPAIGAITDNLNILAPEGTVIAAITGVPAGATPTLSPNDGRFVVAGNEADGWRLERGPGLVSVGLFNGSITAPGVAAGAVAITLFEAAGLAFTNPRTSNTGVYVIFDVSGGTWNAPSGLLVDPAKVAVTATVASVDANGVTTNRVIQRAAGLRAEIHQASPLQIRLWLEDRIYNDHSNVSISMAAGAITSGDDASGSVSTAAVTNNVVLFPTPLPTGRIIGVIEGRNTLLVEHCVMRNPWRAEGWGTHPGGIAGVEWTITKQGQSPVVTWQADQRRSWYQDRKVLSDAQWAANAALTPAEGGLGVYPSPAANPASDPTGAVTVTALFVPKEGGRGRARSITWTVYSAQAGAYPERIITLDTVAGSDANSGLVASAPKLTLAAACNASGSVTGGATQQTVPIVEVIGGTSAAPRDIDLNTLPLTGTGNAVPSATDTWLTIRPAPGYAQDTIRFVNHAGLATGAPQRVRRLCLEGATHDLSDSPTGTSSKTPLGGNTSVYPSASNPQQIWFRKMRTTHRQGKIGHFTEGNSGFFFSNVFTKLHRMFFTEWTHSDTGQRGISALATLIMRDVSFVGVQKDVLKAPDCLFAAYLEDNAVDPTLLPVGTVTGTPQAGDIITGVRSWPAQETVQEYIAGAGMVRLAPGGNSYSFKADDSLTHTAVTISGEVGTIAVGDRLVNTGASRFRVYRRDGNILRGVYETGSFSNAQALTVQGGTATCTVASIASNQTSLFFSSSGAKATASPPHPDLLQIQNFSPNRIYVSGVTGTLTVGHTVVVPGVAVNSVISAIGSGYIDVTGNSTFELRTAETFTTSGGAAGAITMTTSINLDANMILANVIARRMDGQLLFGENGSSCVGITNVIGLKIDAASSLVSQMANISGLVLAHCTLPNQMYRDPFKYISGSGVGKAVVYNIFAHVSTDHVAAGMSSADDKGKPGNRMIAHVMSPLPNAGYSTRAADAYISRGDPLFVNGIAWNENDTVTTLAKNNFRPTAPVPAASAVPIDKSHAKFDIRGVARVNGDWSGAVAMAA